MKNIITDSAKTIRFTPALIAVLLTIGPGSATAGILDTINNKVTTIQSRTSSILSNTNGVQDLVTNVRGVTTGFRNGVITDLQESLGEVQDLVAYLKERRENAGNSADYPDLTMLIGSLETIAGTLQNNPNGGDFGVLSQLLQILPDKLLAVAARGVSKAGIDGAFVNRMNQTAIDLALLTNTFRQDEANQIAELQTQSINSAVMQTSIGPDNPTNCTNYDNNRLALKRASTFAFAEGLYIRITGEIIAGLAKTTGNAKEVGIHGYVSINIETDPAGAIGKVMAGIGTGIMQTASSVKNSLKHCEILFYQTRIAQDTQDILNSNQEVLDSNAVLLDEVCRITRYRSANCQAIQP